MNLFANISDTINGSLTGTEEKMQLTIAEGASGVYKEFGGGVVIDKVNLLDSHYLTFNVISHSTSSVPLVTLFTDDEDKVLFRGICGILPGVETTYSFDMRWLNGQSLFPERTPGCLKIVLHGKPTTASRIKKVIVGTRVRMEELLLEISKLRIESEPPDYHRDKNDLVDTMGQWKASDWPFKYADVDAMVAEHHKQIRTYNDMNVGNNCPKWGGNKKKRLTEGSGYFSIYKEGEQYWLTDPDGYAFISHGVDCVGLNDRMCITGVEHLVSQDVKDEIVRYAGFEEDRGGDGVNFIKVNSKRIFGTNYKSHWKRYTRQQLIEFGFNTVGNWSDLSFCNVANMPYVLPLDVIHPFPRTRRMVFRDFPDVFSMEYEERAADYAKGLSAFVDDPYLIGYFMQNEPNWAFVHNLNIAEELMANKDNLVSKSLFIINLQQKYGDIENLNSFWGTDFVDYHSMKSGFRFDVYTKAMEEDLKEFSKQMIRRYVEIPAKACREVDSNHMNLGMRYAYIHDVDLLAGYEFYDVFSINCYDWTPYEDVERVGAITGKPVMVGEFHFGALDSMTTSTGIKGVMTQTDRGKAYFNYYAEGLKSKYFVGAHYFQWYDQASLGRFDGENYNIGCVTQTLKPYEEMKMYVRMTRDMIDDFYGNGKVDPSYDVDKIPEIFF